MQESCVCMGREVDNYYMEKEKENIREVLPVIKAFSQGSQNSSLF